MFKKMLVASAVLAATTSVAFAGHHHHDFKGERDYKGEKVANVTAPVAEVATTSGVPYVGLGAGVRQTGSYKGLVGNVFAGYGKRMAQTYYLGGEIFADLGSASLAGHANGNRSTYGIGASVIPGMMLTDNTMAYGRVGLKSSHYAGNSSTRNGTHGASQLGAGVQTALTQNWDARAEYVYTGGGVVHNFTKKGSNQMNLGLVYKLG